MTPSLRWAAQSQASIHPHLAAFIHCVSVLPNSALCRRQSCFRAWLSIQPKNCSWNLIIGTLKCLRKEGRESRAPWSGRPFRTESFPYLLIQRRFVQKENPEAERGWSQVWKAMASWFILSPFRKSYQDSEIAVIFALGGREVEGRVLRYKKSLCDFFVCVMFVLFSPLSLISMVFHKCRVSTTTHSI